MKILVKLAAGLLVAASFIGNAANAQTVLRSSDTAEHDPDYRELGRFPTRAGAEAFLESSDRE